jgi:hypothetical protein
MLSLFHGTDSGDEVLEYGLDIDARRVSDDAGWLGWGIYLTDSAHAARIYGRDVLEVLVDDSGYAKIHDPYFLRRGPQTALERLFYEAAFDPDGEMKTQDTGLRAVTASKRVADDFLDAGYTGLITGPISFHRSREVVVFDPTTIIEIGY